MSWQTEQCPNTCYQGSLRYAHLSFFQEKAAIILNGTKLTTDVGAEVHYCFGKEEANRFYTQPKLISSGTNKGGLGWLHERFDQVSWSSLDVSICSKPDMFQVWLFKQCIGTFATWLNMA
jgi:hypothetical protein